MSITAAFLNRENLSDYAQKRIRCINYEQSKPSLQQAAQIYKKNSARLTKPQDEILIRAARNYHSSLGTRSKSYVSHVRRNMDFQTYKRITEGFSTPVLANETAVFHALTEPYRGEPPEHMRYVLNPQTSNEITFDTQDVNDDTVIKRFMFVAVDCASSSDTSCLHIVLSYRHEHPDERKRKGYAHRQRVAERTYWDIAANIVRIAAKASMRGVRVWTDQHYAIRRSTEAWIEEALMPFAMYQVYYHQDAANMQDEGDENRAWLFAEHTFAMLGFGLCSNVSKLNGSWEMFETKDTLSPAMGRTLMITGLLYTAGARIQSYIRDLHAFNGEDVDLICRWSLSINLYGSFYEEGQKQGEQTVGDLEWVALSNVARQANPVTITMNKPVIGSVYSCKEQRVIVTETQYRSWNGIREFSGGFDYNTRSDDHSYVCARLALEMQMRAIRCDTDQQLGTEKYLVALIATSGHGYNFVEVSLSNNRVIEWHRLSEFEIVRRRKELLEILDIPLDHPDPAEIRRRWRALDLPNGNKNMKGTEINWE